MSFGLQMPEIHASYFWSEHQLQVPRNKDDLLKNPALRELRLLFEINKDQFGKASFFIIAPDFINIASMGDKNIGSKNRIASQALGSSQQSI